jgi:hypothetical protein
MAASPQKTTKVLPKTTLADYAKSLSLQGELVQSFQQLNKTSPEMARHLLSMLTQIVADEGEPSGNGHSKKEGGAFETIAEHFRSTGNTPLTKVQLAAATKLSKGTVHTVLYGAKAGSFDRQEKPEGGKEKLILLTPTALGVAKERYHLKSED